MKRLIEKLFLFVFVALFLVLTDVNAASGINRKINFQGRVVNGGALSGTNVSDGNYNFIFSIYSVASAGTSLWSETWNTGTSQIGVTAGTFNVPLGTYVTFPASVDFNSDSLYLGVNFNGDGEMTPRIQLAAVPYAFNAEKVGGLTVTNTTGTLTIPNGKTIIFGDSFATSGVGISLNQSLRTTDLVTFAGLSVGGSETISGKLSVGSSVVFNGLAVGTGTTVLYIAADGNLVAGTLPSAGSTYTATNGLVLNGSAFGLGGTLTGNTSIGLSGFGLSLLGINNNTQIMFIGSSGVGFGTTNPGSKVEINSGSAGTSGLKFTQLTSSSTAGATNNKVLTVDASGNVYLTSDQTGSGSLPSGTSNGQMLRFDGSQWQVSSFVFNNELSVGLGTTNTKATLDIAVTGGSGSSYINAGNGKFLVSGNGGITVSGSTSDIVKTSTSTSKSSDFDSVGSTFVNIGTTGNTLEINSIVGSSNPHSDGTIPNNGWGTISVSSVGATANVGAGGQVLMLDGGAYMLIGGGTSAFGSKWFGVGTTMSQMTIATGATLPGAGAIVLKRYDGRYLLVHGNNSGYSSVFDPFGITAAVAGPPVCGGVTAAAGAGTNAVIRGDGKYVLWCGGLAVWGLYDPSVGTTGTFTTGANVAANFGAGSHALQRDDGNFMVMQGGGGTGVWIYSAGATVAGFMTLNPAGVTSPPLGAGALSIRLNNGKFLVIDGAANSSWLYDENSGSYGSFTQQSGSGYGPGVALADGAQAVWRPDGKYLLFAGVGKSETYVINTAIGGTMFSLGPTLPSLPGAGMTVFMGPDGKYYLAMGGGTKTIINYDVGFLIGGQGSGTGSQSAYYESEPIASASLTNSSTFSWNNNSEGTVSFFTRTGNGIADLQSKSYKQVMRSGDLLGIGTTADNYVQIKVVMKRDLPVFMDQEWGLRKSNQTRYRRVNRDPAVYDFTIDNSSMLHRSQFDFGNSPDESGPVQVNLVNDKDRSMGLSLAMAANGNASTVNNQFVLGAFQRTNVLSVGPSASVVMRRNDGGYTIAVGASSPFSYNYNPSDQTFTLGTGASLPTAVLGYGALAFKRPDGKYLVVLGGGTSTTNIYDPVLDKYDATSPGLTGLVGKGSMVIPLPNGRVMIIHGNYTSGSSIYDPFANTMTQGPMMSALVGAGSMNIQRPDGRYLIVLGVQNDSCTSPAASPTNLFNPYTMNLGATSPAIGAAGRGVGPGSLAIPRYDGTWLVVMGAGTSAGTGTAAGCSATGQTATYIYNPSSGVVTAGPPLMTAAGNGSHLIPRPDGGWTVMTGNNTTTSNIYYDKTPSASWLAQVGVGGTFTAGPATTGNLGAGAISFQQDNGKFVTIFGGGSTGVNIYDGGWVDKGVYRSEMVNIPDLDNYSTLTWKATPVYGGVSAEVKTAATSDALQSAETREVPTSGGLINPNSGDKWLQVVFNFRRTYPSYGGIYNDVWYNTGVGTNGYSIRTITTPMLAEYSVTKDVNLVDLKADGTSVFRVSSNGNVYTSSNGVVNSGGADLAENYTSTQELQKGELVSMDPTNAHGVVRTKFQYQPDVMGVISSDPGFVAGSYTKDSYPVALVGRVPVLVSNENGNITKGDRLTAGSIPGYAMKATKAGRVIGEALEAFDLTNTITCPETAVVDDERKCGKIMMYVNLTDYLGMPVEMVMDSTMPTDSFFIDNNNEKILGFLAEVKKNSSGSNVSQIFSDRVVSGEIVADTIVANKIKANSIEGLEIFTDKIGSLSQKYDDIKKEVEKQKESSVSANMPTTTSSPTPTSGGMKLFGDTEITGNLLLKSLTQFWNKVLFKGEVNFESSPVFNKDTAGFAIINQDDDKVEVKFDQQFTEAPVVNATILIENEDQKAVFDENYAYSITKRSNTGFTILLNKKAKTEIKFAWSALAVKDVKTYKAEISPTLSPLPSVVLGVSVSMDTRLVATPSAETSDSATINSNE